MLTLLLEMSNPVLTEIEEPKAGDGTRDRIVAAAARLLSTGGRDALTTRAVAAEAGVQGPTIYRLFGDKSGLVDAVVDHGFAAYLGRKKGRLPGTDPVENLRAGWDLHLGFGLANPALYSLMYGEPRSGVKQPAAAKSEKLLRHHIHLIAVAGRLRVSEERAANLVHAACCGTVFTLLGMPENERDLGLSEIARDVLIGAITTEAPVSQDSELVAAAVTLRATLPENGVLTAGERVLMGEWLERLAGMGFLPSRGDPTLTLPVPERGPLIKHVH